MANKLPCPNPTCTHEFSQGELQAAAQLACPKCGFRMQGRAAAPAVKTAPRPSAPKPVATAPAKPTSAPPLAQPTSAKAPPQPKPAAPIATSPLPPLAAPIATEPIPVATPSAAPVHAEESLADGSFFNPAVVGAPSSLVRRSARPTKKFNWMRLLIIVLAVGFAASIVITAMTAIIWFFVGSDGIQNLTARDLDGAVTTYHVKGANGSEKAFKLVLPKDAWEVDREIQSRFDVNAAWKRKDDDFWFAVFVKDYGMQKPRDAEMLRLAIDKLEGHFGEALELAAKAEPDKFTDLPAQKLQFKGQAKSANWLGECWMFFKDGLAYWVFVASPEWQKVADFEEEMPTKRIFVAVDRRGWREQPWPTETFNSDNTRFSMTAPKGVWERHDAKNEDPTGQLFLFGKYTREKDNRKNASLLVFTFEKKDDPKGALVFARDYLTKKLDNENKNFKVAHAEEMEKGQTEIGTLTDVGVNRRGRVIDLKMLFNDEPKRYYLLAVINDPDTGYGILCDCSWESRQIWRQDFLDVIRTMKIKKAD